MVYRDFQEFDFEVLGRFEKKMLGERPNLHYRATPTALQFFSRTGYSFLAHLAGEIHGFVLAHAVWQGDQTTVLIAQLLADSEETYRGLLATVVRTAYKAGAYEVAAYADAGNSAIVKALNQSGFSIGPLLLAVRVMESRGELGEVEGELE